MKHGRKSTILVGFPNQKRDVYCWNRPKSVVAGVQQKMMPEGSRSIGDGSKPPNTP